jgi:hypothetical protein
MKQIGGKLLRDSRAWSHSLAMPSKSRIVLRMAGLLVMLWTGLVLISIVFLDAGGLGSRLYGLGVAGRLSLFLAVGGVIGAVDHAFQEISFRGFCRGVLAGACAWLLGGLILYGPSLWLEDSTILAWSLPTTENFRWAIFSGVSVVAGAVLGLIQAILQTYGLEGRAWRRRNWIIYSTTAAAIAWALVPHATINGG